MPLLAGLLKSWLTLYNEKIQEAVSSLWAGMVGAVGKISAF